MSGRALPGIASQLASAAAAAGSAMRAAMRGDQVWASEQVRARRLAECDACPNVRSDWRCSQCGCYLPAKVKLATESCPVGRW